MIPFALERFLQKENGAVMIITIIFILPIAQLLFLTYNAGVTLTTRMRAQCVADAAAFSSSLWQARFLNYCAYTRRHMISNYATIALCTAYNANYKMLQNVKNARGLTTFFGPCPGDTGTLTSVNLSILFPFDIILPPLMIVVNQTRDSCDIMNSWLSHSQKAMYQAVALDTKSAVMQKVVQDAKRWTPAGIDSQEFQLSFLSQSSLSGYLSHPKAIPIEEAKAYFDDYAQAKGFGYIGLPPHLNRGYNIGIGEGGCFYTLLVVYQSDPVEVSDTQMKAKENLIGGIYMFYFPYIGCIPLLIIGNDAVEEYSLKVPFSEATVYEISENLEPENLEPSSLAIVEVNEETVPFYPFMGLHPVALLKGDAMRRTIRGFSRSKVYFRGSGEDLKYDIYQRPNLNYPFWGAKLAPIGGHSSFLSRIAYFYQEKHHSFPEY